MSKYPGLLPWTTPADVIDLISFWSAWVKFRTAEFGVATNMINDPALPNSIKTRYGYRAPRKSDNTAYPGNWYLLGTGDDAAEQAVYKDQQMMLSELEAVRWELWYSNRADISVGAVPSYCDIYDASIARFLALTPADKKLCSFALILQAGIASYDGNSPGTWGNFTAFVDSWVQLALMPEYKKISLAGIDNRPIIGLLYSGGVTDWQFNLSRVTTISTAMTDAGLGTPVYISLGTAGAISTRVTASNTIGAQYFSGYLAGLPTAGGHNSYAQMMFGCGQLDAPAGLNAQRCFLLNHDQDNRPRSVTNSWADLPTYTELEQFERNRYATARSTRRADRNALIHTYSGSEIDEGMVFFPSEQTLALGVNSPSRGLFIDAKYNVRFRAFPSTYTDAYMAWTFNANVGSSLPAGWAIVQDLTGTDGGLTGSDQYAVLRNTTTTNARTWTVTTVRYKLYGTLGPGLGHIGVKLDGGAQVDINQDDGGLTTRFSQLLYDSGALSNASHTLAVARISGQAEFSKVTTDMSR